MSSWSPKMLVSVDDFCSISYEVKNKMRRGLIHYFISLVYNLSSNSISICAEKQLLIDDFSFYFLNIK